ncbi:MAG: hypothetical protein ACKPKO_28280, partial [Candidatus Fonsibacter sp.]
SSTTCEFWATAKGMDFTSQQLPQEDEAAPQRNNTKKECKVSNPVEANDLTKEVSQRNNMGKTTTDENLQVEQH